jgi:hypothetical protein
VIAQFIMLAVFMLLLTALAIALIVVTGATLRRWRGGWRWSAALPILGVLTVALKIVVDVHSDPTAHNLWPFEVFSAVVIAGVVLGSILLIHRMVQQLLGAQWRLGGLRLADQRSTRRNSRR